MIKTLTDKQLLSSTQKLVAKERQTLEKILEHLQEVHRRRLFADLGYSSLFKYLVKELKYSEGAASRRVNALRLVKRIPEAKKMISCGDLNLTVASQTQNHTKDKSVQETRAILKKVRGKNKDEATLELLKLAPRGTAVEERKVRVNKDETRIHVTISNRLLKKLEHLKAFKKMSTEAALEFAIDTTLNRCEIDLLKTRHSNGTRGRAIPSLIKKKVLIRARRCCEFPGCDEVRGLEFEHLIPFARGGGHSEENIKLYCRAHNQRAAILEFGQLHMDQYLN